MKRVLKAALAATALAFAATSTALAQTPTPAPVLPKTLPKGAAEPFAPKKSPVPAPCNVDPAISRIILTKGPRPNQISIRYDVLNLGRSAWRAGERQAQATLTTKNASTGAVTFTHTRALPTSVGAGRTMLLQTTEYRTDFFDTFEFGGTVDVAIEFDPDIATDANPCNDDRNLANNRFSLTADQVLSFMGGAARTRTFTR